MRGAVLIGFEYKNGKKLPGISVDLYQVYTFLTKIGWKDEEIQIFTDIKKDEETQILKTAILEKLVDTKILTFFEDVKHIKTEFSSHNHYNNFSFKIVEKLFVYYSGHSKDGNIILPNNALISFTNFRDMWSQAKEVFLVMDCCEGGIELPYVLHDKIFRLENESNFIKSEMICIASSLQTENSITSRTGSFFTRHLFNILEEENLSEIIKKMKKLENQTANVTVSHPNLHYIFNWFYKFPNIKITSTPYFLEISKI